MWKNLYRVSRVVWRLIKTLSNRSIPYAFLFLAAPSISDILLPLLEQIFPFAPLFLVLVLALGREPGCHRINDRPLVVVLMTDLSTSES